MPLLPILLSEIRSRGPLTAAEFMELALYHPEHGYYAAAAQRSGRAGDFYTSVDVGPLFGGLLAAQFAEMWDVLRARGADAFDLVEAGAGNGRLARDVLDAAAREHPDFYRHLRVTLVERAGRARDAQAEVLAPHAERIAGCRADLPSEVTGAIYANELLDALPVRIVTRAGGALREVAVSERGGALVEAEVPIADAAVLEALDASGEHVAEGTRVVVGLAASDWVARAGAALGAGFLVLFDYGREAATEPDGRPDGTLTAYRGHHAFHDAWLEHPGEQDLTSHVDLTAVRRAAAAAGLTTLGIVDQTYFLLGLGLAARLETGHDRRAIRQRLSAKTLMMPGGLGSTMKAMVFARNAGMPALKGLAAGRLT